MYYLVQIVSGQFPASLAEMVRVKEIDLMEIETSISSDDLDSDHKCNGALPAPFFRPTMSVFVRQTYFYKTRRIYKWNRQQLLNFRSIIAIQNQLHQIKLIKVILL